MGAKAVISLSNTHFLNPTAIKSKAQDDSEYVSLIPRGDIQGQSVAVGKVRDKVTISRAFLKIRANNIWSREASSKIFKTRIYMGQ